MNKGIIKKDDCGDKIPVALTKIRQNKDDKMWYQFVLFYYRQKHYKYILSPTRFTRRDKKTGKVVFENEYKYPWKDLHTKHCFKTYNETKLATSKLLQEAKNKISKLNWKEALKHPDYPMTYV